MDAKKKFGLGGLVALVALALIAVVAATPFSTQASTTDTPVTTPVRETLSADVASPSQVAQPDSIGQLQASDADDDDDDGKSKGKPVSQITVFQDEDGNNTTHRMMVGTASNIDAAAGTFTLTPKDGSAAINYAVATDTKVLIANDGDIGGLNATGDVLVYDVDGAVKLVQQGDFAKRGKRGFHRGGKHGFGKGMMGKGGRHGFGGKVKVMVSRTGKVWGN